MIRAGSSPSGRSRYDPPMERSLRFVLLGTFTLRFSTGLTGAMLGLYLADLPAHGGPAVDARVVGLFAAVFYLTELVLSPVFGILSDRLGHHRVMLYGPIFGAVAVVLTGLTGLLRSGSSCRSWASRGILEGASTAASVPSILGFIALATAGNELLRGKAAARFEGATLAGLGVGFIVAPKLFEAIGPNAFYLNAVVYGISFLIYWRGVKDPAGEAEAVGLEACRVRPVLRARPLVPRPAPGADLDRAQRQHRPVVQPVAVPVLAGEPGVPRPDPDAGLRCQPDHRRGDRHRHRVRGRAAVLGQPVQVDAADDDHPVRDHRRRRARRGRAGGQPLGGAAGLALLAGAIAPRRGRAVRAGRGDAGGARPAGRHLRALPAPIAARSWGCTRSSSRSARSPAA